MSMPEPMRCHIDDCESPLRCSNAGGCIEAQRDGARSYGEALAACRLRRVIPESWRNENKREERT